MTKEEKQNKIIEDIKVRNKFPWDFTKFSYVNSSTKVIVTCPVHQEDTHILVGNLRKGVGCAKCASTSRSLKKRSNTQEFISKAKEVHGDIYLYDKVEYVKASKLVTITCKIHGDFEQRPNCHLRGKGCKKCAVAAQADQQRMDNTHFISRSREVHGDRYDYSKVDYKGCRVPVEIICPDHKSFWQNPDNHYGGSGCPACGNYGFRSALPSYLYISAFENITKVGISNRAVASRINGTSKSANKKFVEITHWEFDAGTRLTLLEAKILKYLKSHYTNVTEVFDGYTECYLDVRVDNLIYIVNEFIKEDKWHF